MKTERFSSLKVDQKRLLARKAHMILLSLSLFMSWFQLKRLLFLLTLN